MKISDTTKTMNRRQKSSYIFFGWYIVAAGMLIQGLGYGSRYSFSVFFPTLLDQFGWPRDLGASILSTHLLFYGLTAPLAGAVVDRFGSRKTMLTGTILLASGLILSRWGQMPWHFYLTFGVLCGIGLCLLGAVPLTMVIRNWFERRRGIALSLVFFGTGIAYACYPAVAWLIDTFGWRKAYTIEGLIVTAVFMPIIYLILVYHPRQKGLTRDGLVQGEDNSTIIERERRRVVDPDWTGREWTLSQAVKTYRFWLLCLTTFTLWGVGHHIIVTHQIAFAIDVGYDRLYASAVLSLSGWMFCLGALSSMISDRIGREATITIGLAAVISSTIVLLMIKDAERHWMLYYFAIAFGYGFGMCAPVVAATVTDIFQGPRVGATLGFIWFSFSIGGTIGPWIGGILFELSDNYRLAFITSGVLFCLGGWAVWMAAPRKIRLVPGKIRD
ncbi:MAG: MFS transporter [Desulfobacterales bacterium]|jgi:MFS family permease